MRVLVGVHEPKDIIVGALAGFTNIFKMAKKIYGQEGDDKTNVKKTK